MELHDRLALSIPDAAKAAGISRSKLYELIEDKELRSLKIGGRRLIMRSDLEAFLEAAREAA
jgi:excisionase family DNA binding protein